MIFARGRVLKMIICNNDNNNDNKKHRRGEGGRGVEGIEGLISKMLNKWV